MIGAPVWVPVGRITWAATTVALGNEVLDRGREIGHRSPQHRDDAGEVLRCMPGTVLSEPVVVDAPSAPAHSSITLRSP